MFCLHCGSYVPDIARFCSSCGKALNTDASPVQASTPQYASPQTPVNAQYTYPQPHHAQTYSQPPSASPPQGANSHSVPAQSPPPPAYHAAVNAQPNYPQPQHVQTQYSQWPISPTNAPTPAQAPPHEQYPQPQSPTHAVSNAQIVQPQPQYPQSQHPQSQHPQAQYPQTQHPQAQYPQTQYQQGHAQPTNVHSPAQPAQYAPVLPQQSTALLSPTGFPQPPFERLAAALFHALDQQIAVCNLPKLDVHSDLCLPSLSPSEPVTSRLPK
jgi:zinc-ribbon domain